MADSFRLLSDDEVRQIGLIIESLDRSTFDFLVLEVGDVKLTLGKGQPPSTGAAAPQVSTAPSAVAPQPAAVNPITPPAPTAIVEESGTSKASQTGGATIVAPLLGRFYAQPEPGAPAFVSVGSEVTADTTVGLIEVMKTFNAVQAGVHGIITEICVQDAQLVEYGDVLFRIQPNKTT